MTPALRQPDRSAPMPTLKIICTFQLKRLTLRQRTRRVAGRPARSRGIAPGLMLASTLGPWIGLDCAAATPGAEAPAEPLRVTVEREGTLLQVRAEFTADAPAQLCYATLADFDRLEEFVPSLESSDVVSEPGEPILLHQVGDASVAFFHVTLDVTLAVSEQPPVRIEFRRIDGNLRQMQGSWTVHGDASRCHVSYRAGIEPGFWVPPLVGPALMRRQVAQQLEGVRAEIERRRDCQAAPPAGSTGRNPSCDTDAAGLTRPARSGHATASATPGEVAPRAAAA